MRLLRIVISGAGGAATALTAAVLAPAVEACGTSTQTQFGDASGIATSDASEEGPALAIEGSSLSDGADAEMPSFTCATCAHTVQVPEAGTFPDLAAVCAAPPPVLSTGATTVTLSGYGPAAATSSGSLSIAPGLFASLVGDPVLRISPSSVTAGPLTRTSSGYSFTVSGAASPIQVTVTLSLACSGDSGVDASLQTVESTTELELCLAPGSDAAPQGSSVWRSAGESCLICCPIVAEMAPTPIRGDNPGDDLPLACALRLRIAAYAHAGRRVLLVAQNDAGPEAEYEWRVSVGTIERVADDIVVWTLPDASEDAPYGQVAVWNEAGAAVENFYWNAA